MNLEYEPYGNEWEKEMMKFSKAGLIAFIRRILIEKQQESTPSQAILTKEEYEPIHYGQSNPSRGN